MESDRVDGMEEEGVAMEEADYNKGLAMTILPEGYNYSFQECRVISEMDEYGEIQVDISARVNVKMLRILEPFLRNSIKVLVPTLTQSLGDLTGKGRIQNFMDIESVLCKSNRRSQTTLRGKGCIKTVQLNCPSD